MGECLSHLQLARFQTDDMSAPEARAVQEHLDGCEKCRSLLTEMTANAAEYSAREAVHLEQLTARLTEQPTASDADIRERPWMRRVAVFSGLAAAAAAIVVFAFVFEFGPDAPDGDPSIAFKGSTALEVTAARDGETFAVKDGTHLRAGDAVRFTLTADRPGYVTVFSVDGKGMVSPFYPAAALSVDAAPLEMPSAGKQVLPGSIILDDAPGPERFVALFSDRPFDRRVMIEKTVDAVKTGDFTAPASSIWVQSLVVEKETASGP